MLLDASSMKVSIYRLMVDPEFYVFEYAESSNTSEFLIIDEELLEIAPFVDTRLEPYARGRFTIPTRELDDLVANMPQARPRQYYIFHHAFVCSTLLARCLAQADAFFSLKEPQIVRRLADMARIHRSEPGKRDERGWGTFLNTHLQLLAKNYKKGKSVVVKASNLANILMPEILRHSRQAKLIYMYGPLEAFLISNLKKLVETQQKIPSLLSLMARDGDFNRQYPALADVSGFSLLQQCAVLWLASNHHFLAQAGTEYPQRVRTLNMDDFLSRPRESLSHASRFFDYEAGAEELDQMAGAAVMERHAKDPNLPYGAAIRERENAEVRREHGAAIAAAAGWLASQADVEEINGRLAAASL